MLGHMCANIFLKYLLDICVFLIIVGMGRTCVYVHHVDKEAFLKGNVETTRMSLTWCLIVVLAMRSSCNKLGKI